MFSKTILQFHKSDLPPKSNNSFSIYQALMTQSESNYEFENREMGIKLVISMINILTVACDSNIGASPFVMGNSIIFFMCSENGVICIYTSFNLLKQIISSCSSVCPQCLFGGQKLIDIYCGEHLSVTSAGILVGLYVNTQSLSHFSWTLLLHTPDLYLKMN